MSDYRTEVSVYKFWKGSPLVVCFKCMIFMLNFIRTIPAQILYFFSSKYKKELIISDSGTYMNMLVKLVFFPYYRNLFYHRIGNISRIVSWILPPDDHIIVPFSTCIGRHANFVHNYGSHLNAESIGDNFICYQHVVVGMSRIGDGKRPRIGDNVVCATGVVIVGDITIGNNVKIGPNSFVNRSLPDNAVVVGNPARIIKLNGENVNINL